MLKSFPYKLLNKYPGMRELDEVIWDAFVIANPKAFSRVWYNVPLGNPFPNPEDEIKAKANGAFEVGQWRIDVLGETPNGYVLIEVKPRAAAGALGQALGYKELFLTEYDNTKNVVPAVLTDEMSPILQNAAAKLGVQILIP